MSNNALSMSGASVSPDETDSSASPVFVPTDELYASQWHLPMIGTLGYSATYNTAGIERIWSEYTGTGIHVGVWDSGSQRTHWDLAGNYDDSMHVSVEGTINEGQPSIDADWNYPHGTSVAGLIAAEANGLGGVGVAFDASLTAIQIFGGADDCRKDWDRYLQTLDSLGNFDVTNHSYGANPDYIRDEEWLAKFETAAELGRNGLGTINVVAAGNTNWDGNGEYFNAVRFSISVAALDNSINATVYASRDLTHWNPVDGNPAVYSTYGAHVLVSAPAAAVTTDLLGDEDGYNGLLDGDYTNEFSGTSAATPVTAGVVTLMLDANAGLGWRDVQNILAYSSVGTGSLYTGNTTHEGFAWKWTGADNWNGGSLHFSEDYGYGMVNVFNAVRMAEAWSILYPTAATSANEAMVTTGELTVNQTIYDLNTIEYRFDVTDNISLEHVDLGINLTHEDVGDLRISLISPDGTVMSIYDGSTCKDYEGDLVYEFGITGLRGESSQGTWTLKITDAAGGDSGTLNKVEFTGYGSTVSNDDVYHYTEEVLTVLAQSGQENRISLTDANGGTDWISAAATYHDLVLDLRAGQTSTLAGTDFLTIGSDTLIENAMGGDGNDTLIGNEADNILYGMRGDDNLTGDLGDDRLDGGAGNDTLIGGDGTDTVLYSGDLADYKILLDTAGHVKIVDISTGNLDSIQQIELGEFAGTTVDLNFTQASASVLQDIGLMYQIVLGRSGDVGGVNYWAGQNMDTVSLASCFASVPEFAALYGAMDDNAFLTTLYQSALLRSPDADGLAYWDNYLDSHSRAELLACWVSAPELLAIQFGNDGLWLV